MERVNDLSELTPNMQLKAIDFFTIANKEGIDAYPFETYRPQSRQDELYDQGRTKPGKKVTWTEISRHTNREAFDVAGGGDGKWHWDLDWDKLIEIGKRCGLKNLAPHEKCHFEDDGKSYNKKKMEFEHDYYKIMEESVRGEYVLMHMESNKDSFEEQLKALLEIVSYRTRARLNNDIRKGLGL